MARLFYLVSTSDKSYFDAELGNIFRGKYEICNPNKSVSASDLYQDLKYEKFPECLNPCTEMKVATHFKYKSELNQKKHCGGGSQAN